jgi:hypothetical protein
VDCRSCVNIDLCWNAPHLAIYANKKLYLVAGNVVCDFVYVDANSNIGSELVCWISLTVQNFY